MRLIELDAKGWKSQFDFVHSLTRALGSSEGHGISPDALVDSIIGGSMNSVEPPYTVQISNLNAAPKEVADYVSQMISAIREGRQRFQRHGEDIEVSILEVHSYELQ
jgi:RNAse (barnase) inhibitor barstar